MYSTQDLKYALHYPSAIQRELLRNTVYRATPTGTNFLDEDWDTLVILDACRYDMFESAISYHDLAGQLSVKKSVGSATKEWVTNTFSGRNEHDLIYVTANGWLDRLRDDIEASVYNARWLGGEEYRNEMGTVEAHIVTDAAIEAHKKSPDKRLLVHYVQPHAPYVGETGQRYFEDARGMNVAQLMKQTGAPDEKLRQAYMETLEHVIPEVRRLLSAVNGKAVITADHGEMLGERKPPFGIKEYGHPIGVYYNELITVPWFEIPSENRRDVTPEKPVNYRSHSDEELSEHLQAMGYTE